MRARGPYSVFFFFFINDAIGQSSVTCLETHIWEVKVKRHMQKWDKCGLGHCTWKHQESKDWQTNQAFVGKCVIYSSNSQPLPRLYFFFFLKFPYPLQFSRKCTFESEVTFFFSFLFLIFFFFTFERFMGIIMNWIIDIKS